MILPAHYTVAEVIEALEVKLAPLEKCLSDRKHRYKELVDRGYSIHKYMDDILKEQDKYPAISSEWQDLSKKFLNAPREPQMTMAHIDLEEQLTALRKLPLDAKVKLTVEEINDLFNGDTR